MATQQTTCFVAVCDTEDDAAHTTAHEAAGKTISDCAMTVTFGEPR